MYPDKQGGDNSVEMSIVVDRKEGTGKLTGTVLLKALKLKLAGGININIDDLPWIPWLPAGLRSGSGAPDKGALVWLRVGVGQGATGHGTIVGEVNNVVSAMSKIQNLPNSQAILDVMDKLKSTKIQINLPPDLQEKVNAAGAKVVEAIEKGEHYLAVLNGLNISGSQGQLAGVVIPQLKNLTTALTPFSAIMSGSITSMLPGVNFNLGNLLNILPDELKKELFSVMPKELQDTLNSYLSLMQNYSVGNFGGSISGMRVNLEVFLPNVVNALKKATTADEMISTLQNVMSDTTMFGLDQLTNLTSMIPTSFGNLGLNIGADGTVSIDTTAMTSLLNGLTSQLLGTLSASGSLLDQVQNFAGMIQRMENGDAVKTTVTKSTATDAYRAAVSKGSGGYQS